MGVIPMEERRGPKRCAVFSQTVYNWTVVERAEAGIVLGRAIASDFDEVGLLSNFVLSRSLYGGLPTALFGRPI